MTLFLVRGFFYTTVTFFGTGHARTRILHTILADCRNLVVSLGGKHDDIKIRPIYCCIKDKTNPFIFWAIPIRFRR
jgi:hypothetical protein